MNKFFFFFIAFICAFPISAQDFDKCLEKAKAGDAASQASLSYLYRYGKGIEKDLSQAYIWAQKAAEQNNAKGQFLLGLCYSDGGGVKKDLIKSLDWIKKAAAQNYLEAQFYLGVAYSLNKDIPNDYHQAFFWYKKAAEEGHVKAQNNLGNMYRNGYGVDKDDVLAVYWYKKAADQGDARAACSLGRCYLNGIGVEKDLRQSFYWYKVSAEKGYSVAQNSLGIFYANGRGVSQNLNQAIFWFKKAAVQGNEDAKKNLAKYERILQEQFFSVKGKVQTDDNQTNSLIDVDTNIPKAVKSENNTFVVIIGNEKYDNEVEVPFAENDATVFYEYVKQTLGIPEKQIKYIANGTLNAIRLSVKWLAQAMEVCHGEGKAIFYYAGHGIPNEKDKSAYILPVDGIGSDYESGYSLARLYEEFGKMNAKQITVFLDACFSGAKREGGMLSSARGVALEVNPDTPKGNMIVFTAAQGDETAHPFSEQHHGMFTYFLLKKLKESKGNVALGELADYIRTEVKRWSFIENNKIQTPTITTSIGEGWRRITLK